MKMKNFIYGFLTSAILLFFFLQIADSYEKEDETIEIQQTKLRFGRATLLDTNNGYIRFGKGADIQDSLHVGGILGVNGQTKLRGEMFFGNSAGTNIYWNGGSDPGLNLFVEGNEISHNVPSGGSHTFLIGGTPYLAVTDTGIVFPVLAEIVAGNGTIFINAKNNLPYFKGYDGSVNAFNLTTE